MIKTSEPCFYQWGLCGNCQGMFTLTINQTSLKTHKFSTTTYTAITIFWDDWGILISAQHESVMVTAVLYAVLCCAGTAEGSWHQQTQTDPWSTACRSITWNHCIDHINRFPHTFVESSYTAGLLRQTQFIVTGTLWISDQCGFTLSRAGWSSVIKIASSFHTAKPPPYTHAHI